MGEAAAPAPDTVAQGLEGAHKALLARKDLQLDLPAYTPPPPRPPPDWWTNLIEFLSDLLGPLGPLMKYALWGGAILVVLAFVYLIARDLGLVDHARARKPRARPADYRPDAGTARALLADADELAAQGRYAEAVHVLLLRSIEDMQRFRPGSVRPAATSRDLELLDVLPPDARPLFSSMARRVEVSLFGARDVDADGYAASRAAYEAFAFPRVWT